MLGGAPDGKFLFCLFRTAGKKEDSQTVLFELHRSLLRGRAEESDEVRRLGRIRSPPSFVMPRNTRRSRAAATGGRRVGAPRRCAAAAFFLARVAAAHGTVRVLEQAVRAASSALASLLSFTPYYHLVPVLPENARAFVILQLPRRGEAPPKTMFPGRIISA